jgi:RimJ/RimL family protein N-acetyltransferase
MVAAAHWPDAPRLEGQSVWLEPVRVEHAWELAPLLDDLSLHVFIGGAPAGVSELEERYRRQVAGYSPDGRERWLNWVVRRETGEAVGTVQATVRLDGGRAVAEVAWVIASAHQGRGYARDSARTMVSWLRQQGAEMIVAHIHPEHAASAGVARAVGLQPTPVVVDGETRWESRPSEVSG